MQEDNLPFITNTEYYKLQQAIRQCFSRSEYAKSIRETRKSKIKGKRGGSTYTCDICKKNHPITNMEIHHIEEVIPVGLHYTEVLLPEFVDRVWADRDKLTYICKSCHDKITESQNIERRK